MRKTSAASIEKMVRAARFPHRTDDRFSISIATSGAAVRRSIWKNRTNMDQSNGQYAQGSIGDAEDNGNES